MLKLSYVKVIRVYNNGIKTKGDKMKNTYLTREIALKSASKATIEEVEKIETYIKSLKGSTSRWRELFVKKFGGSFGYTGFAKASSQSIHFVKYGKDADSIWLHVGCAPIKQAGAGWMMRII